MTAKPERPIDKYLREMQAVIGRHFAPEGMFHGKEGALKLARDLGHGLACFPEAERERVMGSLYSTMLVRFTLNSGGVPLNNGEFLKAVKDAIADSQRRDAELEAQYAEWWGPDWRTKTS